MNFVKASLSPRSRFNICLHSAPRARGRARASKNVIERLDGANLCDLPPSLLQKKKKRGPLEVDRSRTMLRATKSTTFRPPSFTPRRVPSTGDNPVTLLWIVDDVTGSVLPIPRTMLRPTIEPVGQRSGNCHRSVVDCAFRSAYAVEPGQCRGQDPGSDPIPDNDARVSCCVSSTVDRKRSVVALRQVPIFADYPI